MALCAAGHSGPRTARPNISVGLPETSLAPNQCSTSGMGHPTMRDERSKDARDEHALYEQELLLGSVTDVLHAIVHALGMSQKELAHRIGVTEGRVSQILSGSRG